MNSTLSTLIERIQNRQATVGIIGLGYVGLPLALVGFQGARLDWTVVAQRCAGELKRGQLSDPVCRHPEGVAMLYVGHYRPAMSAPIRINTLDNSWLELDAGQKWVLGRNSEYFSGAGGRRAVTTIYNWLPTHS